MKTSESLSSFLNFIRELLKEYYIQCENIDNLEKETQDILHQIELGSYKSRNKYATKLSNVRKQRRVAKDFVDINKDLVSFFEGNDFIKIQRRMENLLGTCRNQERYVENKRNYHARIISDLPISKKEGEEDG